MDYLEILERSNNGPKISKEDWDFEKVVMATRKLVKKYDLQWDRNQIVPNDPNLADRIFLAAMDLVKSSGVYCISTGRIINFDANEIETAIQAAPREMIMGEGKDARTLFARNIMDTRKPIVWGGNPGVPTPENIFKPMVKSWIQEPIVDLATCGSITRIDNTDVTSGDPTEILAVRREIKYIRQVLQETGRPGMGLLAAQSATSELGDLAASNFLRPTDSHLVPMLNELIIDHGSMSRAVNSIDIGVRNASLATVMVGGLAGDAHGAAVVQAASFIAANLVCIAHYHLLHPIDIRHIATSTRAAMWMQGIVQQAFARNAPCIIVSDIYPKSGALTREILFEVAANAIAITVSGGHLEGSGSADGSVPNGTGLEVRLMGEVGHAVASQNLSLTDANRMVLKLLDKYEHVFSLPDGNPGVRFDFAYDLESMKPKPEWQKLYNEVLNDLGKIGLKIG